MNRRQFIKGVTVGVGALVLGVDLASGKDKAVTKTFETNPSSKNFGLEVSQGYASDMIPWGADSALDAVYRLPKETDNELRQRVISKFNILPSKVLIP